MECLDEFFKAYATRFTRKVQEICRPLEEHLKIPKLIYYRIEEDGTFSLLSNCPELVYYYYAQKLHLTNPLLVHPSLLSAGSALVPLTRKPKLASCIRQRFMIGELFLIMLNSGQRVEGFLFASPSDDDSFHDIFVQNLDLLYKFIPYFKHEVEPLLRKMRDERLNLSAIKGGNFWQTDPTIALSKKNPHAQEFLKELFPLSKREMECFELYKRGETAQSTAAILGLSQRTVESYFENIKNKLSCASKNQLLQF